MVEHIFSQQLGSYWFDRGTSGALIDMLGKMPPFDMTGIEHNVYPDTMFDLPFESFDAPLPLFYQSGYLTIKNAEREYGQYLYTLGMPNNEVRRGYADKYALDGRPVIKVGIVFSSEERNIVDWRAE